ncbi:hypothetical protein EON65_56735 [archaeon]|nr:MAG: hypothetical protein EON65_56735 [archaeon]
MSYWPMWAYLPSLPSLGKAHLSPIMSEGTEGCYKGGLNHQHTQCAVVIISAVAIGIVGLASSTDTNDKKTA